MTEWRLPSFRGIPNDLMVAMQILLPELEAVMGSMDAPPSQSQVQRLTQARNAMTECWQNVQLIKEGENMEQLHDYALNATCTYIKTIEKFVGPRLCCAAFNLYSLRQAQCNT